MNIGVLGAGQLGRMLALAGYPLGMRFVFLDPKADAPAGQVAEHLVMQWDDLAALERFGRVDVVTYEFENVPEAVASLLARSVAVYPPPGALAVAQDRLREKQMFRELGIPTPHFVTVDSATDLERGVDQVGTPAVLKTRRLGYDGKGQAVLRDRASVGKAWSELGGVPLILEAFVPFERELSILAVRSTSGETAFYPLVENHHREGMLRLSLAPAANVSGEQQAKAESVAERILSHLGYVGVLAVELFQVEGELLANELAPRVHNSGHFTIEGARTSQFENHLRAVAGLPLGSTELVGHSAMLNLIGEVPEAARILAVPDAHLHDYGKEPRPGRKVGHVTVRGSTPAERDERLRALQALIDEKR